MARRDKDIISYMYNDTEQQIREQIAKELEEVAVILMRSNDYNFNDTAVRAKAFFLAADLVREKNG